MSLLQKPRIPSSANYFLNTIRYIHKQCRFVIPDSFLVPKHIFFLLQNWSMKPSAWCIQCECSTTELYVLLLTPTPPVFYSQTKLFTFRLFYSFWESLSTQHYWSLTATEMIRNSIVMGRQNNDAISIGMHPIYIWVSWQCRGGAYAELAIWYTRPWPMTHYPHGGCYTTWLAKVSRA